MKNLFMNLGIVKKLLIPAEHVIMFDGFGQSLKPTGNMGKDHHAGFLNYKTETPEEYAQHLHLIHNEMDKFFAKQSLEKKSKKKILIFIHGGLNTQVRSLKRIVEPFDNDKSRYELIKEAGYYPIFINWRSSLIHCYLEHLFKLRQGKICPILGPITAPIVLCTDLGRAILRALLLAISLFALNDLKTVPLCRLLMKKCFNKTEPADDVANELLALTERKRKMGQAFFKFELGKDERSFSENATYFLCWLITLPSKIVMAAIIDAFGTSSWDVMLRHIDLLFNAEDEFMGENNHCINIKKQQNIFDQAKKAHRLTLIPRSGGLSQFIDILINKIAHNYLDDWEITLVGHSMGTIVANKMIRLFGNKLPIKKIIYLAGADSIENYEETIYPYLLTNTETEIKHLILHPRAEEGEVNPPFDLPPRGSLLVWLDIFLSKPLSLLERTVGRYDNLLPALHNAPYAIRDRIAICVFSAGKKARVNNPQTHSDVAARIYYWKL